MQLEKKQQGELISVKERAALAHIHTRAVYKDFGIEISKRAGEQAHSSHPLCHPRKPYIYNNNVAACAAAAKEIMKTQRRGKE